MMLPVDRGQPVDPVFGQEDHSHSKELSNQDDSTESSLRQGTAPSNLSSKLLNTLPEFNMNMFTYNVSLYTTFACHSTASNWSNGGMFSLR